MVDFEGFIPIMNGEVTIKNIHTAVELSSFSGEARTEADHAYTVLAASLTLYADAAAVAKYTYAAGTRWGYSFTRHADAVAGILAEHTWVLYGIRTPPHTDAAFFLGIPRKAFAPHAGSAEPGRLSVHAGGANRTASA